MDMMDPHPPAPHSANPIRDYSQPSLGTGWLGWYELELELLELQLLELNQTDPTAFIVRRYVCMPQIIIYSRKNIQQTNQILPISIPPCRATWMRLMVVFNTLGHRLPLRYTLCDRMYERLVCTYHGSACVNTPSAPTHAIGDMCTLQLTRTYSVRTCRSIACTAIKCTGATGSH